MKVLQAFKRICIGGIVYDQQDQLPEESEFARVKEMGG